MAPPWPILCGISHLLLRPSAFFFPLFTTAVRCPKGAGAATGRVPRRRARRPLAGLPRVDLWRGAASLLSKIRCWKVGKRCCVSWGGEGLTNSVSRHLTHIPLPPLSSLPKVDIHNWANLLNRFDDILAKLPEDYESQTVLDLPILKRCVSCSTTACTVISPRPTLKRISTFPRELVLQILRVTCLILENSFNRYLYGSAEYLGDLLRIDDVELVLASLTLLSTLVKKTRSRVTTRIHGDPVLNAQLFYLTKGWGGKQDGLGLLYCVQDKDVTPKVPFSPRFSNHFSK